MTAANTANTPESADRPQDSPAAEASAAPGDAGRPGVRAVCLLYTSPSPRD